MTTPEKRAEIDAALEEILGPVPLPRPKAVVVKDQVVRDADVHVSKADRNYSTSTDGAVAVRRPDYVTINMAAYEEQRAERAEERRRRRELDPYRLGLYGPVDDDE